MPAQNSTVSEVKLNGSDAATRLATSSRCASMKQTAVAVARRLRVPTKSGPCSVRLTSSSLMASIVAGS